MLVNSVDWFCDSVIFSSCMASGKWIAEDDLIQRDSVAKVA